MSAHYSRIAGNIYRNDETGEDFVGTLDVLLPEIERLRAYSDNLEGELAAEVSQNMKLRTEIKLQYDIAENNSAIVEQAEKITAEWKQLRADYSELDAGYKKKHAECNRLRDELDEANEFSRVHKAQRDGWIEAFDKKRADLDEAIRVMNMYWDSDMNDFEDAVHAFIARMQAHPEVKK